MFRLPVIPRHMVQKINNISSGVYYKSFTIVVYNCNDMDSTIKQNYSFKALSCVINYNCKFYAAIGSIFNLKIICDLICL